MFSHTIVKNFLKKYQPILVVCSYVIGAIFASLIAAYIVLALTVTRSHNNDADYLIVGITIIIIPIMWFIGVTISYALIYSILYVFLSIILYCMYVPIYIIDNVFSDEYN